MSAEPVADWVMHAKDCKARQWGVDHGPCSCGYTLNGWHSDSNFPRPTPAQQFAAAAVDIAQNTVEKFQARCATEEAMKDTEMPLTHADERAAERLMEFNSHQRGMAVLARRIEELEATNDEMRKNASEALETLERVAYVLRTFYFAELSISTIQPLIALAIEFNPSIVEQRR